MVSYTVVTICNNISNTRLNLDNYCNTTQIQSNLNHCKLLGIFLQVIITQSANKIPRLQKGFHDYFLISQPNSMM